MKKGISCRLRLILPALALFFALYWAGDALCEQYLSLYLAQRGLTGSRIGTVLAALYLVTIPSAFLMGYFSDKIRSSGLMLVLSVAGMAAAVYVTAAASGFLPLLLSCSMYGFFFTPVQDLADKFTLDQTNDLDRNFGIVHSGGSMGYLAGSLMAGMILADMQFRRLFLWSRILILAAMATAFILWYGQRMPQKHRIRDNRVPVGAIFRKGESYVIYGNYILAGFQEASGLACASVYLVGQGSPAWYTTVLAVSAMIGQMIGYAFVPRILEYMRPFCAVAAGLLLMSVRIGGTALAPFVSLSVAIPMAFVGGFGYAMMLSGGVRRISHIYPAEVGSLAQTLKNLSLRGIGGSLGAFAVGALFGKMNPVRLYLYLTLSGVLFAGISWISGYIIDRKRT
jgi:PPP family 3-phenylpropionic acid transporter